MTTHARNGLGNSSKCRQASIGPRTLAVWPAGDRVVWCSTPARLAEVDCPECRSMLSRPTVLAQVEPNPAELVDWDDL